MGLHMIGRFEVVLYSIVWDYLSQKFKTGLHTFGRALGAMHLTPQSWEGRLAIGDILLSVYLLPP